MWRSKSRRSTITYAALPFCLGLVLSLGNGRAQTPPSTDPAPQTGSAQSSSQPPAQSATQASPQSGADQNVAGATSGQNKTSDQNNQAEANRAAAVTQPNPSTYTPMTEGDRALYYLKGTFSPLAFIRDGAGAGIGQWREKPREWREGARGYQFRYESAFAEHVVKEFCEFTASSIFQEDNRFRPSGKTGVGTRLGYAITSAFSARHSDGSRHFSYSKLLSFAGAALISRMWQPESTRHLKSAEANFGSMWGAAVGFDVLKEFWPRRQ